MSVPAKNAVACNIPFSAGNFQSSNCHSLPHENIHFIAICELIVCFLTMDTLNPLVYLLMVQMPFAALYIIFLKRIYSV